MKYYCGLTVLLSVFVLLGNSSEGLEGSAVLSNLCQNDILGIVLVFSWFCRKVVPAHPSPLGRQVFLNYFDEFCFPIRICIIRATLLFQNNFHCGTKTHLTKVPHSYVNKWHRCDSIGKIFRILSRVLNTAFGTSKRNLYHIGASLFFRLVKKYH